MLTKTKDITFRGSCIIAFFPSQMPILIVASLIIEALIKVVASLTIEALINVIASPRMSFFLDDALNLFQVRCQWQVFSVEVEFWL
ncbi:hypothetical protein HanPI659440_Chr01g0020721 [Helianthus annuus]|nr:hypothetical protein HanPI659440_Chr01g0020721 [Helianthus annuus]